MPGKALDQAHASEERNGQHAKHRTQRKSRIIPVPLRNHLVKPVRRCFAKTQLTMEQSRSNLICIIQVVQGCLGREIKGDRRKQRDCYGHRKLPDLVSLQWHNNDETRMTNDAGMSKIRDRACPTLSPVAATDVRAISLPFFIRMPA